MEIKTGCNCSLDIDSQRFGLLKYIRLSREVASRKKDKDLREAVRRGVRKPRVGPVHMPQLQQLPALQKTHCMEHKPPTDEQRSRLRVVVLAHKRKEPVVTLSGIGDTYKVKVMHVTRTRARRKCRQTVEWMRPDHVPPVALERYFANRVGGTMLPTFGQQADYEGVRCNTCKEEKRKRKCARSGGWLYGISKCGFVLHLSEIIGGESLSQRLFFIAEARRPVLNSTSHHFPD